MVIICLVTLGMILATIILVENNSKRVNIKEGDQILIQIKGTGNTQLTGELNFLVNFLLPNIVVPLLIYLSTNFGREDSILKRKLGWG
jgi:hypothetical protein